MSYSSYFRDITSGSNGVYNATVGYDLVTGLGSPLTAKFGTILQVSPTSGPPEGAVTLNGAGFAGGSFVNISYLNPYTSEWIPVESNVAVTSTSTFTYALSAPDLLQNNPAGDNEPALDAIVFRAQYSNGTSFETVVPYMEYRRGLSQIGGTTAVGLYGNNTDLTSSVSVQGGQSILIRGSWFNPGIATLLLDGTTLLNSVVIDENGQLEATIDVPNDFVGQHTLTVKDKNSDFCISISTSNPSEYLSQQPSSSTPSSTATPSPLPSITPKPSPSAPPTDLETPEPSPTPQIQEIPLTPIIVLLFVSALIIAIKIGRRN
ncbi:MAG: hypothetical protein NWE98_08585 [Candidatus Bathyarchaeota archaeon]|nr:hypothetical protein [Candidatus Bathyarchaeota archaeon]